MKRCLKCKKDISLSHSNRKRCLLCAKELLKNPYPNKATPELVNTIRKLSKTMFKKDIAKQLGLSWSFIGRVKHHFNIEENFRDYPKYLVKQVSEYYSEHGKRKTIERFPEVNVKALERYFNRYAPPRQIRWTASQIRDCARMGGLVPIKLQAKYFNRPGAHAGSIKSFWHKRFKESSAQAANGLPFSIGQHFVKTHKDLTFRVKGLAGTNKKWKSNEYSRRIILWVDLEKHLKPETPEHIRMAIQVLAKFQRWLHGTSQVRLKVKKMIQSSTPDQLSKHLRAS